MENEMNMVADTIMLVDDNENFIKSAISMFSHLNIPIVGLTSGEAAFEEFVNNTSRYALILIDLAMPDGWDGIETIRRIRNISNIKIAILSAHCDEYEWERQIDEMGASIGAVFRKPIPLRTSPDFLTIQNYILDSIRATEEYENVSRLTLKTIKGNGMIEIMGMTYREFVGLEEVEATRMFEEVARYLEEFVQIYFRDNPEVNWIVIGKPSHEIIIYGSSGNEPTEEQLDMIARRENTPVFAFVRLENYEEGNSENIDNGFGGPQIYGWTARGENDYYPTVPLYINEKLMNVEFDTGSPFSFFSYEVITETDKSTRKPMWLIFVKSEKQQTKNVTLWGTEYQYYNKTITVSFPTKRKSRNTDQFTRVNILVRAIKNWSDPEKNPIVRHYANRIGLLGRDILYRNKMTIILDGETKTTKVLKVG